MTNKEKKTAKFKLAERVRLAKERRRCPRLRPRGLKDKKYWNYDPQRDFVAYV